MCGLPESFTFATPAYRVSHSHRCYVADSVRELIIRLFTRVIRSLELKEPNQQGTFSGNECAIEVRFFFLLLLLLNKVQTMQMHLQARMICF